MDGLKQAADVDRKVAELEVDSIRGWCKLLFQERFADCVGEGELGVEKLSVEDACSMDKDFMSVDRLSLCKSRRSLQWTT